MFYKKTKINTFSPVRSEATCQPSPYPSQPAGMETPPEDTLQVTTPPQLCQQIPFASTQLFFSQGAGVRVVKRGRHGCH